MTIPMLMTITNHHCEGHHSVDQEEGEASAPHAQENVLPTMTALQQLSLGDSQDFTHGNQEMLVQADQCAGEQGGQGGGQAYRQHGPRACPQDGRSGRSCAARPSRSASFSTVTINPRKNSPYHWTTDPSQGHADTSMGEGKKTAAVVFCPRLQEENSDKNLPMSGTCSPREPLGHQPRGQELHQPRMKPA